MSADFSEMNLRAISLESESPPALYTTQQPHSSKGFNFEFLESLQEIPLEEILAESTASEYSSEDDLRVRIQGGLTEVDNELLSALMEIRNHIPSEGSYCTLNSPEIIEEQNIIQSNKKEDHKYHVTEITSDYESDTNSEPEASNIDSDSYEDPSTDIPCLPLPRYRSVTPEYEHLPSMSIRRDVEAPSTCPIIRPRPVRHRRPIMNPLRHNRKKLDANLRMALFLREDPQKYIQVLDKREGITPRMCKHRKDIRNKVNKRGLEYETGFMRWRVHWRSRLAVGAQWCMVEGKTEEVIRRTFYVGKAMELDGWVWTRYGEKGVRNCGWEECGAGLCGWRGMEIFLPTADYGDDEEVE